MSDKKAARKRKNERKAVTRGLEGDDAVAWVERQTRRRARAEKRRRRREA